MVVIVNDVLEMVTVVSDVVKVTVSLFQTKSSDIIVVQLLELTLISKGNPS